jgi:hypothetical protein
MTTEHSNAFGEPGIQPRWTSSAKKGVGTTLSNKSHVWFTLSHFADLFTQALSEATEIKFTFYWPDAQHWEGKNFVVCVGSL